MIFAGSSLALGVFGPKLLQEQRSVWMLWLVQTWLSVEIF